MDRNQRNDAMSIAMQHSANYIDALRADLARVEAERDDYRNRWEQTGCTRHDAMDTAIKLNESCREQLESAIRERDRLRAALQSMLRHLSTARDCIDNSHRFYQSRAAFSAVQEARAALNGEGKG